MNVTGRVLHPLVQCGEEDEEEASTLWLAGEMSSVVKAAGWRVARLKAPDPCMAADWFLVGLVWVRLPVKVVLRVCSEWSMAVLTSVISLLKASIQ
jgi:hypothetical protein